MANLPPSLTDLPAKQRAAPRAGLNESLPESDDSIRNLKASEAAESAFQAAGIPSPPADLAAIVGTHVKGATRDIPLNQLANMAPGSGQLNASAVGAVNMLIGSLDPTQREMLKAGINPLDPAAALKFDAAMKGILEMQNPTGFANGGRSGARYDGMAAANGDWGSPAGQAFMRQLAIDKGIGWAANNPDLLRLGPTAIQALADVKLSQQSYEHLTKKFELTPRETVQSAVEAKKRGVDLNGVAETADKIDQRLPPEQQPEFRRGQREFFPKMNDPGAQRTFNGRIDRWKQKNPHLAPEMEQLRKDLKIEQKDNTLQHGREDKAAAKREDALDSLDAAEAAPPAASPANKKPEAPESSPMKDHSVKKAENAKPEPPKQKEAAAKTAPAPTPA